MRTKSSKLFEAMSRAARDSAGTTAIEFAIVAPAFIGILLGSTTIGWDFAAASTIDNAIVKIARQVEAHSKQPVTLGAIEALFCANTILPGQCKKGNYFIQVGDPLEANFQSNSSSFVDIKTGSINVIRITTDKSFLGKYFQQKDVSISSSYAVYVK